MPYTITNNTISIPTLYAPNGDNEIELAVQNQNATLWNSTNEVMDQKQMFGNTATLTLDFENRVYLANSGDMTSPDAGTAYITYGATQNMSIAVSITSTNGTILSSYTGPITAGNTLSVPWNFTMSDGVTPYTNDQYVVTMTATPSSNVRPRGGGEGPTIVDTNTIDRHGVRTAGWVIINDMAEDPGTQVGAVLDPLESTWDSATETMYENLYYTDWASLTEYDPSQIGANRDNPSNYGLPYTVNNGNQTAWPLWLSNCVANPNFSDFEWFAGHANGLKIGSGPRPPGWNYVETEIYAEDVATWAVKAQPNWRFRKIAMWGCDTANKKLSGEDGQYYGWFEAFGTRGTSLQLNSCMWKNVALLFDDELQAAIYDGGTVSSFQVAAFFDMMWVEGMYPFPGGCDPTYSFRKVTAMTLHQYPELNTAKPLIRGFPYLPYSGVYDAELLINNTSNIKD